MGWLSWGHFGCDTDCDDGQCINEQLYKEQAELLVEAPPLFTYICPLTPVEEILDSATQPLPEADCVVLHSDPTQRNFLHLYFEDGLEADTTYTFKVDVVNAS